MSRVLVGIGNGCAAVGLLRPRLRTIPLGPLPGDRALVREHVRLPLPFGNALVAGLAASILFWFFRQERGRRAFSSVCRLHWQYL